MRERFPADNFTDFQASPVTVTTQGVVNLGDIEVPIEPMDIDGLLLGDFTKSRGDLPYVTPVGPILHNAQEGTHYILGLHIAGGLRDIRGTIGSDSRECVLANR